MVKLEQGFQLQKNKNTNNSLNIPVSSYHTVVSNEQTMEKELNCLCGCKEDAYALAKL